MFYLISYFKANLTCSFLHLIFIQFLTPINLNMSWKVFRFWFYPEWKTIKGTWFYKNRQIWDGQFPKEVITYRPSSRNFLWNIFMKIMTYMINGAWLKQIDSCFPCLLPWVIGTEAGLGCCCCWQGQKQRDREEISFQNWKRQLERMSRTWWSRNWEKFVTLMSLMDNSVKIDVWSAGSE